MNLAGAGQVRIRQVGHGQLTGPHIGCVSVLGQRLLPVPHLMALCGGVAKLVVQADLGNAVHIAQALGQLKVRVTLHAALQRGDDLCF